MKKVIISLILILPIKSFSQHSLFVDSETKLVTFEKVYELDTLKADYIFDKAKEWFIEYFREASEVIRGENKPSLIKGTFINEYFFVFRKEKFNNDITVRIKDGAIKITINNFRSNGSPALENRGIKKGGILRTGDGITKTFVDVDYQCKELSEDLIKFINSKSDW